MRFRYEAVDAQGAARGGEVEATSETEAFAQLRARDLTPVQLRAAATRGARSARRRLTAADRAVLVRELATLLGGGVTLAEAIASLAQAHTGTSAGAALERLHADLRAGQTFATALAASGLALPDYAVQLAAAGETTGQLGAALTRAAEQMEYDGTVRQELSTALTYPVVLVVAGITAVLIVFLFVVPRFANIVRNPRADVPALSRFVIESGVFLREHQGWLLLAVLGLAALLWSTLRQPAAREQAMATLTRMPVVGRWLWESNIARWAALLGALLASRVPLVRALDLARMSVRLAPMRAGLQLASGDVQAGKPLSEALRTHGVLPPLGVNMIRVGERAGELPRMLETLAQLHQQAGRARMKQFLALIEPAAIVLIGGVIGIIMIAVILGITSLSNLKL